MYQRRLGYSMKLHFSTNSYPSNSRAAAYGDGCFTTMLVEAASIHHRDQHLERLRTSCQRLQLPAFDVECLRTALAEYLRSHSATLPHRVVLKVLVTIAGGGRGYRRARDGELDVYVSVDDYPSHYRTWQMEGISLGVAALRLGKQPALAGVKHLNRLEQVLIKQEHNSCGHDDNASSDATEIAVDERVVCDCDSMMVETSLPISFGANTSIGSPQAWMMLVSQVSCAELSFITCAPATVCSMWCASQ